MSQENESTTRQALEAIVAPLAIWLVTQIIERTELRKTVRQLDRRVEKSKAAVIGTIRRRARNTLGHPVYLAAGIISIAAGITLIAKSTSR